MTEHDPMARLLLSHDLGTLVTIKRDGRPQVSIVNYHYEPAENRIRISVREPLAKTQNLRRDPRASFSVAAGTAGATWWWRRRRSCRRWRRTSTTRWSRN